MWGKVSIWWKGVSDFKSDAKKIFIGRRRKISVFLMCAAEEVFQSNTMPISKCLLEGLPQDTAPALLILTQ